MPAKLLTQFSLSLSDQDRPSAEQVNRFITQVSTAERLGHSVVWRFTVSNDRTYGVAVDVLS